jgi:hypothetical protein
VADGSGETATTVPGHRPGVTQAEIDVFDAIDVDEPCSVSRRHMDRERARPTGHPRHRDAGKKVSTPAGGQRLGTRMQFDESLQFALHLVRQALS